MTRATSKYSITLTMRGWDEKRDNAVMVNLKGDTLRLFGTGFGLEDGQRELVFFAPTRTEAEVVKRDIEKALRNIGHAGKVRILSLVGPRPVWPSQSDKP
jgi:hypothetical protein